MNLWIHKNPFKNQTQISLVQINLTNSPLKNSRILHFSNRMIWR